MMHLKTVKRALLAVGLMFSASVSAQDLIASQAPTDRRMKAVDSVALQRVIQVEARNYAANLYPDWNNRYAHKYSVAAPDSFRIDMRNFAMPTPSRVVTSNFGYRASFGRMHKGLDIKVYIGDTIVAAFDGRVRIVDFEGKGYGNYVVIRHNNGLETIYGHLSKHLVRANQEVKAGEPIGLGGNTGRSTGSHLHFETRILGEAINPALLFDFPNQDVTCDEYLFRSKGGSQAINTRNGERQQVAVASSTERSSASASRGRSRGGSFHKVKKGESLYSIARKKGVSVNALMRANHLSGSSRLRPGQVLKLN
jgi:murein DD-endopeptidase MepM/ murein hydrolase activator NlpD